MKATSEATGEPSNDRPLLDPPHWLKNYGDQLYNYALTRVGRHDLAEELVQDTLLAAVRNLDSFRGCSSEKTWLFGILKNKILSHFRTAWRQKKHLPLDEEADPEKLLFTVNGQWKKAVFSAVPCPLESRELWQIVQQCLHKLPSNQARVFILKILEEKKTEEICHELEISASNLSARLYRARLGLARCVAENWSR
jgi:RNA polymerase sigma-70 factor (ECF subfamily)